MKRTFSKVLSVAALLSTAGLFADDCNTSNNNKNAVVSCYMPRSVGSNAARKLVGLSDQVHLYDMEEWYGTFAVTGGYSSSRSPKKIAQCLFGPFLRDTDNCKGRTIFVKGGAVADRDNDKDLVAENFNLPSDFASTLTFKPKITHGYADFDLYVGLDCWCNNLYLRVHGPIDYTSWNLNFSEEVTAAGTTTLVTTGTPNTVTGGFNENFESYIKGDASKVTITNAGANASATLDYAGLSDDRMDRCSHSKTGFADLRMELGWNFVNCEDYHLGINIQAAAPTGNKKDSCLLFAPVVGNGNHWEVGAGLTGHYVFWRCDSEDRNFGFYLDANVTHLFKAKQKRTFDLKNKPLSRYMLAGQFGSATQVENLFVGAAGPNLNAAGRQLTGKFAPVANLTTLCDAKVSVGAQVDIAAMFNFNWCNWGLDFGYNFWYRGCEKVDVDCKDKNLTLNKESWGLLNAASNVVGFNADGGQPVLLSQTSSTATLSNAAAVLDTPNAGWFETAGTNALLGVVGNANSQVETSLTPVLLKTDDVNFKQKSRGQSHKVFGHLSYTWDCECWIPYLGVGGDVEFGKNEGSCPTKSTTTTSSSSKNDCSTCVDCSLSQWSVWAKLGVSFN